MIQTTLELANEIQTQTVAASFADCLTSPLVLTFSGEIGAGKTTFIRAMLHSLGIKAAVKSPTFSLVESYQLQQLQIHHFDLYRIQDETELDYIGFRDYFAADSLCCIEWPERVSYSLDFADINFAFTIINEGRLLTLSAFTPVGENMLSCFAGKQ